MTSSTASEWPELLAEVAKSLLQAYKVNDEFTAFTQPLAAKLQHLFKMLQTQLGSDRFEAHWYRPDFYVSPPRYSRPGQHIDLGLRQGGRLSFEDLGKNGFGVIGYHSKGPNTSQVRLDLSGSYQQQNDLAREHWKTCFADAHLLVDSAIASVQHNTPLQQGLTWREELRLALEHERPRDYDHKRWSNWVERWAEPDMKESFVVAQSLFDVKLEHTAWKAQLLSSWSCAPTSPLNLAHIDSDLFEPTTHGQTQT